MTKHLDLNIENTIKSVFLHSESWRAFCWVILK